MEDDIVTRVLDLYKQRNWREIANSFRDHPDRNKLLWVFPTEDNFTFINKCMKALKCDDILSIGCGSGLLEWMLQEATGLPVTGVEVDGAWWQSKYAPPTFIPLLVTTPTLDNETISLLQKDNNALLFCYFNNKSAFMEYLKFFSGSTLIIIGPDGKGVHTDPRPFGDVNNDWILYGSQEVCASQDFIAIYRRKQHRNLIINSVE